MEAESPCVPSSQWLKEPLFSPLCVLYTTAWCRILRPNLTRAPQCSCFVSTFCPYFLPYVFALCSLDRKCWCLLYGVSSCDCDWCLHYLCCKLIISVITIFCVLLFCVLIFPFCVCIVLVRGLDSHYKGPAEGLLRLVLEQGAPQWTLCWILWKNTSPKPLSICFIMSLSSSLGLKVEGRKSL